MLGVEQNISSSFWRSLEADESSKLHVHRCSIENSTDLEKGDWDVIVVGSKVQFHLPLADSIRKKHIQGLKIVLTEKENLRAAIDFWGSEVYSYLLKPVNRDLFRLLWQNAVERVELNKKVSRLSQERKRQRADGIAKEEYLKDLFTSHLTMQELNQEKTNFLARTSHELLTPLTALKGYLELVANGKPGPVNEVQLQALNASLDICRRLHRLSMSLTDHTALEQSHYRLQFETRDILECLSQAVSELQGLINEKGLDFKLETNGKIPPFQFDFDRMLQVFVNLIENAVKFTPAGGTIRVRCNAHVWDRRTAREMIYGQQERRFNVSDFDFNSVRICVEDNGPGVPPEFMTEIFEEYSRVESDNGSPRGFGLGLAVSRRIVLAHQGKIWVEGKTGQGSAFKVLIPVTL